MKYRQFGKLDWKASALGFGCMRLPRQEDSSDIDVPEAIRMLRYAIDHGVNYLDTAYPYHDGQSEIVVGKALQDGYRDKVRLATKLPSWLVETYDDFDKYLNEQLEKLQVEHIDYYLLHGLRTERWEKLRDLGVIDWAEGAIDDGRIGHLCFSFHDDTEAFKKIIDDYDGWTMAQIQYNYMDIENQAGTEGLKYAASKGIAVVVMEPLLGGRLVDPPEPVEEIWDKAPVERDPVNWALQWLWNQPEVSVVLSGMSTMSQVKENVAYADESDVNHLSEAEREAVAKARETYEQLCPIPCTGCKYCMPCPQGVNIPRVFQLYNRAVMYNQQEASRRTYQNRVDEEQQASECIQCEQCEELCPQEIPVSQWMPEVDAALRGAPFVCQPQA